LEDVVDDVFEKMKKREIDDEFEEKT